MKKKFKLDKQAIENIDSRFPDDTVGELDVYDDEADALEESIRKRRRSRRIARILIRLTVFFIVLILIMAAAMLYTGYIWFNEPRKRDYPVRGPVIDSDMGRIQWSRFAGQNIQLCYITATKGKNYVDERFDENKKGAAGTKLPTGYLHVFEPDENGRAQAEHFIDTVGESLGGRLTPAVDIDLRGLDRIISPDKDNTLENLKELVADLTSQYGTPPILKCRMSEYETYVEPCEELAACPVWIDSVFSKPSGVNWTLWTYSPRVRYSYYDSNSYLDVAVLKGGEEDLKALYVQNNGQ